MLRKIKIFFVGLAIVVNVLLAEGSPIYHGQNNDDLNYLYGGQFNNPYPLVVPAGPAYSQGEKTNIQSIYQGPVFIYNNYENDAKSLRKLMEQDNNIIKMLKAKNNQNCQSVEPLTIESYYQKLLENSKKLNGNAPDADEDSNADESLEDDYEDDESFEPTNKLFENILASSEKLSYATKSDEELRNEVKKTIKNIICDTLADYESTDEHSPEFMEIWINKVMSYLNMMKMNNKRDSTADEIGKAVKSKIDKIISNTLPDYQFTDETSIYLNKMREGLANSLEKYNPRSTELIPDPDIYNFWPEVSALFKDILKESEKLSNTTYPKKSAEEFIQAVKTQLKDIVSVYEPDSDKKAMSYLMAKREDLANLLEKYSSGRAALIPDEYNFSPQISELINAILMKSEYLYIKKYKTKSAEEIKQEVKTNMENLFNKIKASYQSTKEHTPESYEIWTNKVISFLTDIYKDLTLDNVNQPNGALVYDDIDSWPKISAVLKEVQIKTKKLESMENPTLSSAEIRKISDTKIAYLIDSIKTSYQTTDGNRPDPEQMEIWVNKVISILNEMNKDLGQEIDNFQPNGHRIFDKINSMPDISLLIKDIQTKSEKLYPTKSAEEIRKSVRTKIENIITDTILAYKSTDEDEQNSEFDWSCIEKMISHLTKIKEDLAHELDGVQPNDDMDAWPQISALLKEIQTKTLYVKAMKHPTESAYEIKKKVEANMEILVNNIKANYEPSDDWTNNMISYLKNMNEDLARSIDFVNL